MDEIYYKNSCMSALPLEELTKCAKLFSTNYGFYTKNSPVKPLQPVSLSTSYYKKNYNRPQFKIVRAFHNETLIGQALYAEIKIEYKYVKWVVQLVVKKEYRRKHVGTNLLRHIYNPNTDEAFGLATVNPCTIEALEKATGKICDPSQIYKNIYKIYSIKSIIPFAAESEILISNKKSIIKSGFFVDNTYYGDVKKIEKKLGVLSPGDEWLGFIF